MLVYFPQKSRPFALLSRSSPSNQLCSLLLCAPGAPQQWALQSAWRRHGSAGTRVCMRARVTWPIVPVLLPCTSKRGCQTTAGADPPFEYALKLHQQIWFSIRRFDNLIDVALCGTHEDTVSFRVHVREHLGGFHS